MAWRHPPSRLFSIGLAVVWLISPAPAGQLSRAQAAPCNPSATAKTKQVLDYLKALPVGSKLRVLAGQNVGHGAKASAGYSSFVTKLADQTGKWIALLGVDYGLTADSAGITAANQVIKQHWSAGGLVTISIHFTNPFTGGDAWDRSGVNLNQLLTPGSSGNTQWMSVLGKVATGLAELRDAGVVVLWRPLHEMNGDWFWWSSQGGSWASPADFGKLWRHMFDYFSKTRGLNNLLWVYAPNVQTNPGSTKATAYFYPGSDVVDVVGMDAYLDDFSLINSNQSVSSLVALGKPFGLTEWGPKTILNGSYDNARLIQGIKAQAPQATFFLQWHSWSGAAVAIVDNKNAGTLMNDPWVISRGQIVLAAPAKDAGPAVHKDAGPPAVAKEAGAVIPKEAGAPPRKDAGKKAVDHGAKHREGGPGLEASLPGLDASATREAAAPSGDFGGGPRGDAGSLYWDLSHDAARSADTGAAPGGSGCSLSAAPGPQAWLDALFILGVALAALGRARKRPR